MIKPADTSNWEAQTRKNTLNLAIWTGIWVLTTAIASFGPALIWNEAALPSLLAILLNFGTGIGMILANRKHLLGLDELEQRIMLEAMAMSLGIGLIVGISYSMLDIANLIGSDAEIAHLIMVMGVSYMVGMFRARRRYL